MDGDDWGERKIPFSGGLQFLFEDDGGEVTTGAGTVVGLAGEGYFDEEELGRRIDR